MDQRLDAAIRSHYEASGEARRLMSGPGRLEFARTCELLERFLPAPPAVVLDVGGGPGVYARWLAGRGYEVHLIDPVPLHVEQARSEPGHPPIAGAAIGDARRLERLDASADAVILLGPLYHLTQRADRLAALFEARRVLREGGVLMAAGISRFASALDGLASGFLEDPRFVEIVKRDLAEGQHRNPTGDPRWFTTAFFHHPDELCAEVAEAGFSAVSLLAVEGPAWIVRDLDRWLQDAQRSERLLACIRSLEREPTLLGASAHLMAAARRQG